MVAGGLTHTPKEVLWDYYSHQRKALAFYRTQLLSHPINSQRLTPEDVDNLVTELQAELERQTCLALLACAEASFRIDFDLRVRSRLKRPNISRRFRTIRKGTSNRVRLQEDILDEWKTEEPNARNLLGQYKEANKYRNWLAHGRYWKESFPRQYLPDDVFKLVARLESELPLEKLPKMSGAEFICTQTSTSAE